jgi:hypothetical protein
MLTGAPVFLNHGPLLLLSAVLIQSGILMLGLGVLAEILARIYVDGERRRIYTVDRVTAPPLPTVNPLMRRDQHRGVRPS